MLLDLGIDDIRKGRSIEQSPEWVRPVSDGIEVTGDRVGYRETFIWNSDDRALIGTNLDDLLERLSQISKVPDVSPFGISQVLNHGFVPIPYTVYDGLRRIAGGDTVTLVVEHDRIAASMSFSCHWSFDRSREDQIPSTATLRDLIARSLGEQLASAGGAGFLMLSSGKDSVAIALALADGGHASVPCITFKSGPQDLEHVYAADLCDRLGLEHITVEMPEDPVTTKTALLHFFEHSPLPSIDFATIPYAIVTQDVDLTHGGIIDGSGNDGYMGYLPSKELKTKYRWRVRNRRLAGLIRNLIPHDSPINYLTRSKADTPLPGRMLRDRETRRLYASAVDTDEFWYEKSGNASGLDIVDFIAVTVLPQTEYARTNPKILLAAHARGLDAVLPFCDERLADYYFNLPEGSRFDRSKGTNKLLLRRLLSEAIDYDPDEVGTNYFQFDGVAFLLSNAPFVREEILSCDLWLPEVRPMLDQWMTALPKRPFLYHSLLALFMLSGWHNHSCFINPPTSASL